MIEPGRFACPPCHAAIPVHLQQPMSMRVALIDAAQLARSDIRSVLSHQDARKPRMHIGKPGLSLLNLCGKEGSSF
jgi:hypothetical protein